MTRKVIPFNDANWRMGSVAQKTFGDVNDLGDVKEWSPARVPGDVRLDLLRAGRISDPFVARNNEESQWVDALDWWYVHDLALDLGLGERAFLVFDGIDYQSAVFVDGKQLGRHVGMFSRQVYELPRDRVRHSQLAVRVWGSDALPKLELSAGQKIWRQLVKPLFSRPNEPFPDRYATLKCQMQFGWDFSPRLRTCGIWDDADVIIAQSVFIQHLRVKAPSAKAKSPIQVFLSLDSDSELQVSVRCKVQGKNFSSKAQSFGIELELRQGKQDCQLEFELQDAREWNPWDRGDPNLYEIEVQLVDGSGQQLDSLAETFGIRSFELRREGEQQDPWTFIINGNREFIRGANWVPLDAIPGRLRREDYAARLKQARDANVNFLRVWGGGLRNQRAFYDLCDELGILVWQEFPFAGAILDRFPSDRAFLTLVDQEGSAIVRSLRNHPALVVWCGGNEFNTRGNCAVVETLRGAVEREDGTRPFKPASPYRDESHHWRVWHRSANLRDYKKDQTPFLSEFGLQSTPNADSLAKFLPGEALFPPNATWEYHHAELKKLKRYATRMLVRGGLGGVAAPSALCNDGDGFQAFVLATQRAQAFGLQIAIEHMRRRKAQGAAGVSVWQFNDSWPSISWSLVDYYGAPKASYHAFKRACSPVLAAFDYPLERRLAGAKVHGDLWIVNDWRSSFTNAELQAYLNGEAIYSQRVNVASDSAERVGVLDVPLGGGENILRLKLNWGPAPLCENEYDLNDCDHGEINPLIAAYVAIGNRLMR